MDADGRRIGETRQSAARIVQLIQGCYIYQIGLLEYVDYFNCSNSVNLDAFLSKVRTPSQFENFAECAINKSARSILFVWADERVLCRADWASNIKIGIRRSSCRDVRISSRGISYTDSNTQMVSSTTSRGTKKSSLVLSARLKILYTISACFLSSRTRKRTSTFVSNAFT